MSPDYSNTAFDIIATILLILVVVALIVFTAVIATRARKAKRIMKERERAGEETEFKTLLDKPVMQSMQTTLARAPSVGFFFTTDREPKKKATIKVKHEEKKEEGA